MPARSAAETKGTSGHVEDAMEAPGSVPTYRILVVDDEKSVLEVLHDMLVSHGYVVDAVASPAEALQRAKRQRFDALVLDLYMPEMSGMLFHAKLRLFDPELAERTVFISGYVSRDELREHLASTASFLEKPFKSEELVQMAKKVLPAKPRH